MIRSVTYFLFCLFCTANVFGQPTWHWAVNETTPSNGVDAAKSVCTDTDGNVIVSGFFRSPNATFGSITLTNTDTSASTEDAYLVKYDANGIVLWAQRAGGSAREWISSIDTDSAGNIYATGWFNSPAFIIGADTLINTGGVDLFIAKYDTAGNVIWAHNAVGNGSDESLAISADGDGNAYITGNFFSNSLTFGSLTIVNSSPPFSCDLFVVKYDPAGNALWARRGDGPADDRAESLCTDPWGNVFVTGEFYSQTMAFGPFILLTNPNQSVYSSNVFIAKYDTNGNILWARSSGMPDYPDLSYSVTTDGNGSAYTTGSFRSPSINFGTVTLSNAGYSDIFVAKYDSAGNVIWARRAGGSSDESACAVTSDSSGTIFVSGLFSEPSCTFGSLILTVPVNGNIPLFLIKYDAAGNVICGSAIRDGGGNQSDVHCDESGNAFLCGAFGIPQLILGPHVLTLSGQSSSFVAKYSCDYLDGVTTFSNDEPLFISPNPCDGIFSLNHTLNGGSVSVMNSLGEIVFSSEFPVSTIDLSDQPNGIYLVAVRAEESFSTQQVIISR